MFLQKVRKTENKEVTSRYRKGKEMKNTLCLCYERKYHSGMYFIRFVTKIALSLLEIGDTLY